VCWRAIPLRCGARYERVDLNSYLGSIWFQRTNLNYGLYHRFIKSSYCYIISVGKSEIHRRSYCCCAV